MIKALLISLLLVVLSSCASVDTSRFERTEYIKGGTDCASFLKLEGTVLVESCAPCDKGCISAGKAVYDYTEESAKIDASVLRISVQASPWHLYDSDMRILTIEELAEVVKLKLRDDIKRIVLVASWSAVAPNTNSKSLAQKLSDVLEGFPVSGMDGFVWMAKDGTVRTTHQAFTGIKKRPYGIHQGEEVMISLVAGWPIVFEEDFIKKRDSYGIMRVGAAWEIFMLCLDRALQSFEAAAKLSNPIAAYNAAMIRLERGKEGDFEEATKFFKQAVALGDKKAQTRLQEMTRKSR